MSIGAKLLTSKETGEQTDTQINIQKDGETVK